MNAMPTYLASGIRLAPRVRASVAWTADCGPVDRPAHAGVGGELPLQHHLQH